MSLKSQNYTLLTQGEAERDHNPFRRRRWSAREVLKWVVPGLLGVGVVVALMTIGRHNFSGKELPDVGKQAACPQYPAIKAHSDARIKLEADIASAVGSEAFFDASIKRLQGAVQIPTESFDDMGLVGEDSRWEAFGTFQAYLEKSFPLV